MQRPSREELIALAKVDPEAIADLVLQLWDRVEQLEIRIAGLERNSRSSSKPPSTDKGNFTNPPKPDPKSLRGKSCKKPGGQQGHPGSTLEKVVNPDHIEFHDFTPGQACSDCGCALPESSVTDPADFKVRQVHDIPPIKPEVTEHRARKCACPGCGKKHRAPFPAGVDAPAQYGPNIQATALYLGSYQLVPFQRLGEIFAELFACPLSQGTLANFVKKGGQKSAVAVAPIREALVESPVLHADETGCTLHGRRHWLHVLSTDQLTCYHLDAKRGREAMDRMGLLPRFKNLLIHDCLGAYFTYEDCRHGLCNARHQRELTYLHEQLDQNWACEMIELLLDAKDLAERELSREEGSRRVIGDGRLNKILSRYFDIIGRGYLENPEPPPKPKGKKGPVKRSKSLNLLRRMEKRWEEILGYFFYPGLYPYDNNQAERDVRMMKVREKINGTFRSAKHGKAFCDIRGIISSARKQKRPILAILRRLFFAPTALGESLARGS